MIAGDILRKRHLYFAGRVFLLGLGGFSVFYSWDWCSIIALDQKFQIQDGVDNGNISDHERVLKILNDSGQVRHEFGYFSLKARLEHESYINGELPQQVLARMSAEFSKLDSRLEPLKPMSSDNNKRLKIFVATVICGDRRQEAIAMLKSVLLFGQDANLHLIVFSDNKTIVDVGQDLLAMKWTAQRKLGFNFSFELQMDYFPNDTDTNWKSLFRPCATQRLFFPGLLAHIDSLIYLDSDVIVLSNMTKIWEHFHVHMEKQQMIATPPNNPESIHGWYKPELKIPYVGERGLHSGVMLMNLTRLRSFKFEQRALASHALFKERIQLTDQDIIDIVFSGFPEFVHDLGCTYNFHWCHCGPPDYKCINEKGGNLCFCKDALDQGIRVVHGSNRSFSSSDKDLIFLKHVFQAFKKFNLATDSALTMIDDLRNQFDALAWKPCKPLNSSILYDNADRYLRNLKSQGKSILFF